MILANVLVSLLWHRAHAKNDTTDFLGADHWEPESDDGDVGEASSYYDPEDGYDPEDANLPPVFTEEEERVLRLVDKINELEAKYGEENLKAMDKDALRALLEEPLEESEDNELLAPVANGTDALAFGEGGSGAYEKSLTEAELAFEEQAMLEEESQLGEAPDEEAEGGEMEGERRRIATCEAQKAANIGAFTSATAMVQQGWKIDVSHGDMTHSGVKAQCGKGAGYFGWSGWNDEGTLRSPVLKGTGTVRAVYGNCWDAGVVRVYHNGVLKGSAPKKQFRTVTIDYKDGDTISFKDEDGNSVIQIKSFVITSCSDAPYAYIGCYVDDRQRDLSIYKGNGKTHAECSALCKDYKFFSMQNGSECYCGQRYATKDNYVQRPDHECGGSRRGGGWRNAIFRQDKKKGGKGRFTVAFVSDLETRYRGFHENHVKRILEYIRDIKDKNLKFDRHNDRIDTKLVVHGGDMSTDENPWAMWDWNNVWKVVPNRGIPLITTFGNHDWKPRGDVGKNKETLEVVKKSFESAAHVSKGDFKYERFAHHGDFVGQDNYWAEFRGLQLGVFGPFAFDKAYHKTSKTEIWSSGPAEKLRTRLDRKKPTMFVSHAPVYPDPGSTTVKVQQWQVNWMKNMIDEFPIGTNHFAGHTHRPWVQNHGRWRDFTAPYPHWFGWTKKDAPRRCGPKPNPLTNDWKRCMRGETNECSDCKGCTTTFDRCDSKGMPITPAFLAILVDPEIGILEVKKVSLETADVDKGSLEKGEYCHLIQCKKDCPDNGSNWEWWYDRHPHGYRCGESPKWGDGTYCLQGTSCNQCRNKSTWWYGKHPHGYRCGREPCWRKGTKCAAGTSCNACCNGDKIEWWGWFTLSAVRVCK